MEFRICELQLVPQLVQLVDISCKKKNMRQAGQRHMFLPTYPENCPLFWKNPSPSEENIHFGGEIKSEIVPFFLYGLVTYMTGIFLKKIGQNRSVLPSAVPKRIYTRLCGVATTNQIIKTNTQWSIQRLSSWVTNQVAIVVFNTCIVLK